MLAGGLSLACGSETMGPGGPPTGSGGVTGLPGGSGGTVAGGSGGSTASCATAAVDTDATVLRRLSALEYRLTVQDLLLLPAPPEAPDLPRVLADRNRHRGLARWCRSRGHKRRLTVATVDRALLEVEILECLRPGIERHGCGFVVYRATAAGSEHDHEHPLRERACTRQRC